MTAPSSYSTVALTVKQAKIANEVCRARGLGTSEQDLDEVRRVCRLAGAGFSVKYLQERYEATQRESSPLSTVSSTIAPSRAVTPTPDASGSNTPSPPIATPSATPALEYHSTMSAPPASPSPLRASTAAFVPTDYIPPSQRRSRDELASNIEAAVFKPSPSSSTTSSPQAVKRRTIAVAVAIPTSLKANQSDLYSQR